MIDFSNLTKKRNELAIAINSNSPNELEKILETSSYFNLNYVDQEGETLLHRSCLMGNLDLVKILVKHGANQSIKNKSGWFPIHIASFYGHIEILMFLIDENNFKHQNSIAVFDNENINHNNNDDDNCNINDGYESDDYLMEQSKQQKFNKNKSMSQEIFTLELE
jgi:ankyrin repeat protein